MTPTNLNVLNYPITTQEAEKFWASRHKANIIQAIIAFSLSEDNANNNMRRYGYTNPWRDRALRSFGKCVNHPEMTDPAKVTFFEASTPMWVAMPIN